MDTTEPVHEPEPGDVYGHRSTSASVIVLSLKDAAVRLGRPNHETPMEIDREAFLEKYEWLGQNVLTEKERHALGIEGE